MGVLPPDLIVDARTAVRIVCGLFFLPHTFAKLRNIERASQFFDKAGLRPPRFFVVLTTVLEVVAACGLISGLYPRLGATIAACILLVAAGAIARVHALKWRWQHPGVEYMLFWAIICLCAGFLPQIPQ
jgi:putative oxidoreductase